MNSAISWDGAVTPRMRLHQPTMADVDEVFSVESDPRVWTHLPTGVATDRDQVVAQVQRWRAGWHSHGLGTWAARGLGDERLLGYGGCQVRGGEDEASWFWNLGYRFRPEEQGRGLATELSKVAMGAAAGILPEVPIVAYLVEHNLASAAVARKLGMTVQWRGPDAGNPDPGAIRLVFADCELTPKQLASTLA